VFFFNLVLMLV